MKLDNKELMLFTSQISMILKSGISLSDGILALSQEIEDEEYKNVLINVSKNLDNAMPIYDAFKEAGMDDEYMISLISIGEKSGYLDKVMEQLSIYYERLDNVNEKFKDAITYPSILILMMIAVISILVIKVLPIFESVLNSLGTGLNGLALVFMNLGQILARYGFILLALIVLLLIYFAYKLTKNSSLIKTLDQFKVTKHIGYNLACAQFAFALSLLMNSGYDSEQALKEMPELIEDSVLKEKIVQMIEKMNQGKSFEQVILESKVFKSIDNRLLTIGFKAGQAESTMAMIAKNYETEVDNEISRFLDIVEPSLVAILSIIIGIILLSVMLPLMSVMSSL